jgi:hypothetical protein
MSSKKSDCSIKYDNGKPRLDLFPPSYWPLGSPMHALASWFWYREPFPRFVGLPDPLSILEYGAAKYGEYNWIFDMRWSRLYAAALRHITIYAPSEQRWIQRHPGDVDPETGRPHWEHFAANVVFLRECHTSLTDRQIVIGECDCPWYQNDDIVCVKHTCEEKTYI